MTAGAGPASLFTSCTRPGGGAPRPPAERTKQHGGRFRFCEGLQIAHGKAPGCPATGFLRRGTALPTGLKMLLRICLMEVICLMELKATEINFCESLGGLRTDRLYAAGCTWLPARS